jgi:transglutaminase-like putative cysteine protease
VAELEVGSARVRQSTARSGVAVSGSAFLAIAAALSSFVVLLDGAQWALPTMLTVGAVIAAGLLVRARVRTWRPLWSVLAAFAAGTLAIQLLFAADTAFLGLVPLPGTLARASELIAAGEVSIAEQGVPADADAGIQFVLAVGVGLLAVVVDAVASLSRRPALVAVPLLGILTIPVILAPGQLPVFSLLATAAAFFLLLAVHRPSASGGVAAAGRAVGVGASVLVAALIVPPLLPPVLAGSVLPGAGIAGLSAGINPVLDLGDDLRRPVAVTVLRYTSEQSGGMYLSLAHLDAFDGQSVQPVTATESRTVDVVGPPTWLGATVSRTEVSTRIALEDVRTRWVPLPSAPVSVSGLDGDWLVAPDGIAVQTSGGVLRDGVYTVQSLNAQPSGQQLAAAGVDAPGLDSFRVVPELDPTIAATAQRVVGAADAQSPYAQALALQRYFTGGDFVYSEEAPVTGGYDGSGADVVATFLQVRAGYCVHFASAMTLMARTLGIPARIAVGFQPGTPNPDAPGEFVVSSNDLHAWPELHFDGIGWVRFEPTPTRGAVPSYADASSTPEGGEIPESELEESAPDEGTGAESAPTEAEDPTAGPTGIPDLLDGGTDAREAAAGGGSGLLDARAIALTALSLLVLLLVGPGVWRAVRRARRRRSPDPLDRWREVRDTARDLGLPAELTRTPRALAALWQTDAESGAQLALVRSALEARAYAAPTSARQAPSIDAVLRGLRQQVPWWRRTSALIAPLSLLDRTPREERVTLAVPIAGGL